MHILIIFLLFAVCTLAKPSNRIVDGDDATPHEFPYQVSVQYVDPETKVSTHYCGGSILSSNHVLTAAHCKLKGDKLNDIRVIAGAHDFSNKNGFEQTSAVKSFVIHEKYVGANVGPFDLGIIKLKRPFKITAKTKIQAARLPEKEYNATETTAISGWGNISKNYTDIRPKVLQKAIVEIFGDKECHELWKGDWYHDTNICAGKLKGVSTACKGDSGGPLSQKQENITYVIGITSWAHYPCGKKDKPTVFVETALFVDWIQKNMS